MKRSEGFFGLHFDFHAGADCNEIGKTFTEEMAREIIETLKPDFIQCDCKGHPGYSSYPTIAGNPAPGFVGDPLKIWRKVTSEYGVPLTMHYSGVFDRRAIELHPEWAATGEDKTPNKEMTSVFKGYADGLLIPQLIELANGYGVDAVWVDGECWASVPDFDEANVRAFEGEYKMKLKKDADGKYEKDSTEYKSFLDYSRGLFKDYLTRYVDAVHAEAPQFEIASNWAYSSFMPVPVESGVNFLSGDFNSVDSYNAARLDARVLCEQGMPWDLVAWGFFYTFQKNSTIATKGVPALCREAASVITLGGGFTVYHQQNRDASVNLWEVRGLRELSDFVLKRKPFLQGCEPFSNVGVLYSDHDMGLRYDSLHYWQGGENKCASGAVKLLLDSAMTCRALLDHTLEARLAELKTVLLPEIKHMKSETKEKLLKFVESGGNLVVSGYEGCVIFEEALAGIAIGELSEQGLHIWDGLRYVKQYARFGEAALTGSGSEVLLSGSDHSYGVDSYNGLAARVRPAVTKTRYGEGFIVAIYYNAFEIYDQAPDFFARDMIANVIAGLDGDPVVSYKGPKFVDIATAKKDGKLLVSLTNTSGVYAENRLRAYYEILPVTDFEVIVKTGKRPEKVSLQPENAVPENVYDPASGRLTVRLEKLQIHTIIVIE